MIPRTAGVEASVFPDLYRGPFSKEEAGSRYADMVKETIDFNTPGKVAAMLSEPIQGAGGVYPLPIDFMPKAVPHVRAAEGLLISDEVQTGFGKLGSHYWGTDYLGYKADIITMAKHLGNGFPMGAVATSKEIASSPNKMIGSTYGGNPVAMATGREVLRVIDDEKLQERTAANSKILLKGLNEIKDRYECVGDVRGQGLLVGVEIVKDKESKEPDFEMYNDIHENMKDYGLLVGKGGRYEKMNVYRLQPPMCINEQDVEFLLDVMERSIQDAMRDRQK